MQAQHISLALSQEKPWRFLAGPHTKQRGPCEGWNNQHVLYAYKATLALVRPRDPHERRQTTQRYFFGELATGSRSTRGPKLRYKDACKWDLKAGGVTLSSIEAVAADRSVWKLAVESAVTISEEGRKEQWEKKRAHRREKAESPPSVAITDFICNTATESVVPELDSTLTAGAVVYSRRNLHCLTRKIDANQSILKMLMMVLIVM